MFYKPKFCCHCGEKIDRVNDWELWTVDGFAKAARDEFRLQGMRFRARLFSPESWACFSASARFCEKAEKPLSVTNAPLSPAINATQNQKNQQFTSNTNVQNPATLLNPANNAQPQAKKQTPIDPNGAENLRLQSSRNPQNASPEAVYFAARKRKKERRARGA